jgi:hypothetical protein
MDHRGTVKHSIKNETSCALPLGKAIQTTSRTTFQKTAISTNPRACLSAYLGVSVVKEGPHNLICTDRKHLLA